MKDLITITTENMLNNGSENTDGFYNIIKHGHKFSFEDKEYTYHSSGLARTVYKSECGGYVIKVPNGSMFESKKELEMHIKENLRYADPSICHNYYEAKAYEACPEEFKIYLAKTELLPNCWVRQEFIEVLKCSFTGRHDLREIGKRKDGSFCIFDYDPLLDDFIFTDFDFTKLPNLIGNIANKL